MPRTVASQVTPSQALELLSELTTVPETEVPLVGSENETEAYTPPVLEREIDRPYVSIKLATITKIRILHRLMIGTDLYDLE